MYIYIESVPRFINNFAFPRITKSIQHCTIRMVYTYIAGICFLRKWVYRYIILCLDVISKSEKANGHAGGEVNASSIPLHSGRDPERENTVPYTIIVFPIYYTGYTLMYSQCTPQTCYV